MDDGLQSWNKMQTSFTGGKLSYPESQEGLFFGPVSLFRVPHGRTKGVWPHPSILCYARFQRKA